MASACFVLFCSHAETQKRARNDRKVGEEESSSPILPAELLK
jgi:hypothetical protein